MQIDLKGTDRGTVHTREYTCGAGILGLKLYIYIYKTVKKVGGLTRMVQI